MRKIFWFFFQGCVIKLDYFKQTESNSICSPLTMARVRMNTDYFYFQFHHPTAKFVLTFPSNPVQNVNRRRKFRHHLTVQHATWKFMNLVRFRKKMSTEKNFMNNKINFKLSSPGMVAFPPGGEKNLPASKTERSTPSWWTRGLFFFSWYQVYRENFHSFFLLRLENLSRITWKSNLVGMAVAKWSHQIFRGGSELEAWSVN